MRASILTGVVLLTVLAADADAVLCSTCECLPQYAPLCALQTATGKYRGFRSLCELDCSNQCRKDKFVFVARGRCGKYLQRLSSTTTTSTTPVPAPAGSSSTERTVSPVEAGVFSPLLQALLGLPAT